MLLQLDLGKTIEKIRFIIPYKGLTFEVDEFLRPNNNLILPEIELPSENTPFQKPYGWAKKKQQTPSYLNTMM